MKEDLGEIRATRREFLKAACKTAGYAVPLVVGFQLSSIDTWADEYPTQVKRDCNNLVEKLFNTSCW